MSGAKLHCPRGHQVFARQTLDPAHEVQCPACSHFFKVEAFDSRTVGTKTCDAGIPPPRKTPRAARALRRPPSAIISRPWPALSNWKPSA